MMILINVCMAHLYVCYVFIHYQYMRSLMHLNSHLSSSCTKNPENYVHAHTHTHTHAYSHSNFINTQLIAQLLRGLYHTLTHTHTCMHTYIYTQMFTSHIQYTITRYVHVSNCVKRKRTRDSGINLCNYEFIIIRYLHLAYTE